MGVGHRGGPTDDRPPRPLGRLLVANRGEIAVRILRTAQQLGLATAAVAAPEDGAAPHAVLADVTAVLPGGGAAAYLDVDAVVAAARQVGADAVHPGYGFLAERADAAQAVVDAGLRWIGPSPTAIRTMADKQTAKDVAAAAGLPVLPSCPLDGDDPARWQAALDDAGVRVPLMVKAVSGGGGRGMRVVTSIDDLPEAVASARREAAAGFGDPTVFAEAHLAATRHVEVQILGDGRGGVVHLGDRDCSVQRRHQKLVEEAPCPSIDDDLRAAMAEAAVRLGEAIDYEGVGTVELLVPFDGPDDTLPGGFAFCEMNTRLQVEHPVTELVWGLDLVRCQLLVAEGVPLREVCGTPSPAGHAIEVRLVAEDPAAGWLPSPGTIHAVDTVLSGVRIDSGVVDGSEVTTGFDPLLAKLVVHAPDRHEARRRLARALRSLRVAGPTTNRELLVGVLEHEAFARAETTTAWLDATDAVDLCRAGSPPPEVARWHALAVALADAHAARAADQHWACAPPGWSNVPRPPTLLELALGDQPASVTLRPLTDGRWEATVTAGDAEDGARTEAIASLTLLDGDHVDEVGRPGRPDPFQRWQLALTSPEGSTVVRTVSTLRAGAAWWVHSPEGQTHLRLTTSADDDVHRQGGSTEPVAPLPGTVGAVHVAPGDEVAPGSTLVVLEAMKVEHRITTLSGGRIAEVLVAPGDAVVAGQLLVRLEENS